ncbi:MAG: hypothetical protein KatS3mg043_0032 [Rhodothermaceae bacterium]|nr:MAG: hypothetical protein KatS3mg043_0032 [Rhodothermaceae bacterium]
MPRCSTLLRSLAVAGCALLALPAAAQETPPFDHPLFTGPVREAPLPPVELEHLHLDLRPGPAPERLAGRVTLRLVALVDSLDALLLAAPALHVDSVHLTLSDTLRRPAPFRLAPPDTLLIRPDTVLAAGTPFALEIAYTAAPRRGLYATGAFRWASDEPDVQAHWTPLLHTAGDRFTADVRWTVKAGERAYLFGLPKTGQARDDGTLTYHFTAPYPVAFHHLLPVSGPLAGGDTLPGARVTATYAAPPNRLDAAARTLAHVPEVIRFLTDHLRYPFPTPDLALVAVPGLHTGDAAAPGLVLLNADDLLDERARLDENPDTTLARLLARQWFGTLVAADFWTDRWLDDAFPAYLGARFAAHVWGEEALALHMDRLAHTYRAEAARYVRPLVWDRWEDPAQMRDAHSRAKGAWVLYMIRQAIGDEAFRRVLNRFLYAHDRSSVETGDFVRALEAETRRDWGPFFDQWVYAAGHPVLEVAYAHDAATGRLDVTVRQVQEGPLVPEVFEAEVVLEVETLAGTERFPLRLHRREARYTFPLRMPPRFVVFDAGSTLLAEVRMDQPVTAWVAQLRDAAAPVHRLRAARALATFREHPDLLFGLRSALAGEPDATVRAAIVETMGKVPPAPSVERALLDALSDPAPAVRAAALDGLGAFAGSEVVARRAVEIANTDRSYRVQAAAVRALARIGAPQALDVIRSALITPSHRDVIRQAALTGLARLDLPARTALDLALPYTEATHPAPVRIATLPLLHALAGTQPRARERLWALLDDPDPRVRRASLQTLLADGPADRARLERRLAEEPDPDLRFLLRRALERHAPSP